MITLKALRLAAIVMAHNHPRCNVLLLPNGGNMLEGTCWATRIVSECMRINACRYAYGYDPKTEDGWVACDSIACDREAGLLTERFNATVASVRDWLGY